MRFSRLFSQTLREDPADGEVASQKLLVRTLAGFEPLVDDRAESAGVKLVDADLIGLPLRITVSERAQKQGGVEFKLRSQAESFIIPLDQAVTKAKQFLKELEDSTSLNTSNTGRI